MKKMRYLNKIVFINSAHTRYAEVAMDGNVHFTGTQGVGKTTLLRAILFFYNCKKDRLGIRIQGQQAFDDFYVPTPSSYIIYEVVRGDDEPPFSIILFRHHNRAAFRFVDAPYSKAWFIDDLGVVASDNLTIRQRIQSSGIVHSGIIERYTQYLDILYGNRNAHLSKDLLKYYLLKSPQYQSIPRIIQNVFLNERVDAGFIKNIIINSITGEDEEIAVDLNFFRSKLIHFNDEMKDLSLWTDKNRQGIVETRRDADKIIEISHNVKAIGFALHEQCGMLCYARSKAERDIPILQSRIEKREEAIRQLDDKIRKISFDYDQEQKKINGRISILSDKLKTASDRKKEYQRIGIEDMIARSEKSPVLKLELRQKENILSQLTSSHQSISDKYKMLRDRLELDMQQYLQTLKENKNSAIGDFNAREKERISRKALREVEIHEQFKNQLSEFEQQLNSYRELINEQKMRRVEVSVSSPRKEEIAVCEHNIAESERKANLLIEDKLKKENLLNSIQNKFELDCQRIENDTDIQIKDIEGRINQLETLREEERSILNRVQGSLCEWLDNNIEGWEKSIGKVVDEKHVLYSQNLSPTTSDDSGDSIFGLRIDLDSIEKEVRTPAMIRESILSLDKKIQTLTNSIIKLREERDAQIEEIGKDIRNQIKTIKTDIDTISQKIEICRRQAKQESLRLDAIKEEEKNHIGDIIAVIDEKIKELQSRSDDLARERSEIEATRDRELRKANKMIADEEKTDKSSLVEQIKSIDSQIKAYTDNYNAQMKQIKSDEAAELADSGADTQLIEAIKKQIEDIISKLDLIDREREKITEYRKDCRELLDHVSTMQSEKKKLEGNVASLQQKYNERREKYISNKSEEEKVLSDLRISYGKTTEAKQKTDEFIASNACPAEIQEANAIHTDLDCLTIISTIKDLTGEKYRLSDTLKESINEFRKRFTVNNTFKFPTAFDTINDYHSYAESLDDFISNDKINDFQQVTSNLYRDILSRAASDFNILLGRESEIQRIIRDINYDFDKKTFAGVIRRIELRIDRSTMPVITQFQNITDFWNSHQYELGEINLFSTDGHSDINREATKYLKSLSVALNNVSDSKTLALEETFSLKFRITENDNTTDWVENIRAVGSEGTDILVKAIINILLISVFKKRAGQAGDFKLHCMMDEIGRLADENIQGILNFANQRGIYIVNSSPKAHRPLSYRRLYMLSKDNNANTIIQPILSIREAELS